MSDPIFVNACTDPVVSSLHAVSLFVGMTAGGLLALVLVAFVEYALGYAKARLLGHKLLDACGGDVQSAELTIRNTREYNQVLTDYITRGFAAMHVGVDDNGRPVRTRVHPFAVPDDTQ